MKFSTKLTATVGVGLLVCILGSLSFYDAQKSRVREALKKDPCRLDQKAKPIGGQPVHYAGTSSRINAPIADGLSPAPIETLKTIRDAIVYFEDKNFRAIRQSPGDYLRGDDNLLEFFYIAASVISDYLKTKELRGGSQIENQLQRQFPLNQVDCLGERPLGFLGKLQEFARAFALADALETEFGKEKAKEMILTSYIEHAKLGLVEPYDGWPNAARFYYNKAIGQLTVPEIVAFLMTQTNPSDFHPTSEGYLPGSPEMERYQQVLERLWKGRIITQAQYDASKNSPPKAVNRNYRHEIIAANVLEEANQRSGIVGRLDGVTSTINYSVQAAVERVVANLRSEFPSKETVVTAMAVDSRTNSVLAEYAIGPKSSFNYVRDGAYRWDSLMKSVVLWAFFIVNPDKNLDDRYLDQPNEDGWPRNADGAYKGEITISQGYRESRNAFFVNLYNQPGVKDKVFEILQDIGGIQISEEEKNAASFPLGMLTAKPGQILQILAAMQNGYVQDLTRVDTAFFNQTPVNLSERLTRELPADFIAAADKVLEAERYVISQPGATAYGADGGQTNLSGLEGGGKTGTSQPLLIRVKRNRKTITINKRTASFYYRREDGLIIWCSITVLGDGNPSGSKIAKKVIQGIAYLLPSLDGTEILKGPSTPEAVGGVTENTGKNKPGTRSQRGTSQQRKVGSTGDSAKSQKDKSQKAKSGASSRPDADVFERIKEGGQNILRDGRDIAEALFKRLKRLLESSGSPAEE